MDPHRDSSQAILLESLALAKTVLAVGQSLPGAARLKATHFAAGSPAAGVEIRYFVADGPCTLDGHGAETVVTTDDDGIASIVLELTHPGYFCLGAELAENPLRTVFFDGYSSDMTDQITVYAPPALPAGAGEVKVEISAVDAFRRPVLGARLGISGMCLGLDAPVFGEVEELGGGRYRGRLETNAAGSFIVTVEDAANFTIGSSTVSIAPEEADSVEVIGVTDPRQEPPFDALDLTVLLADRFGNPLDPGRLQATREDTGEELEPILNGSQAIFPVSAVGYVKVPVLVTDCESEVEKRIVLDFAAVWLGDPGLVFVGDTYATPVFAIPPVDRPTDHGTVEIAFDPHRVSFDGFVAAPGGFSTETGVEEGMLKIDVRSKVVVRAEDIPQGVCLGEVHWRCEGEGNTCFDLIGKINPSSPPYRLCVDQKRRLDSRICVHLIYPRGNTFFRELGIQVDAQIGVVISSQDNLKQCCPDIDRCLFETRLDPAEYVRLIGNGGVIGSSLQFLRLVRKTKPFFRDRCINITIVPFNLPGGDTTKAWTSVGYTQGKTYGESYIGPGVFAAKRGAIHEIGHALGLRHATARHDRMNLMYAPKRGEVLTDPEVPGPKLTAEQCKIIFDNLGLYPCP